MKTLSKKVLLILVFSVIMVNYCQSQDTTKTPKKRNRDSCFTSKKNEIRLGGFNLTGNSFMDDLSELYYLDNNNSPNGYYPFLFNDDSKSYGIGYRCNSRHGAFRLSVNMDINSGSESYPASSNIENYTYSFSYFRAKIGYEWHVDISRSEFYYGLDYLIGLQHFSDTYINNQTVAEADQDIYNSTETGVSCFLGAKYFLTKMLSVSVETSLDCVYTGSKYNSTVNGISQTDFPEKNNNFSFKFIPISVFSIGIHL